MPKSCEPLSQGVEFTKQTPEMLIERPVPEELYEKAFLSPDTPNDCEWCQNSTTWD